MRALIYSLLSLATVASTLAIEPQSAASKRSDADDDWEERPPDTVFNGQTVPPMIELRESNIEKEISKGNWLVEFFSPTCPHCMHFKPTYQTAYEFYYTSKPIASKEETTGDSLNSFTRFYDFKFAKVDCMAYADTCTKYKIESYPSMIYFKNGVETQRERGSKDMANLSKWVEQLLEAIKPGTRKEGGPKLPKPGAKAVETGPDTQEETKEQEKKEDDHKQAINSIAKATKTAAPKVAKPKPTTNYNPDGVVQVLTSENFDKLVSKSSDLWFIKFFAPWCHHCQALAPTWENMARQMRGKLNIGSVNCDIEKKICKDAGVRGYPTMLLFRGGEHMEYDGLRGLGDLLDYADKATALAAGVADVTAEEFKKLEETNEVIFTYFYNHATTSEDLAALDRLTLSLVGKGKLVKTDDAELAKRFKISTWPRLIVSRDGKATHYPPFTPKEMRDTKKMLAWMKTVWLPLVPEVTSSNAREIMDNKMVVLAILNRNRVDFQRHKRELKSAALEWIDKQEAAFKLERQGLRDAKQIRIEEAEDKGDDEALQKAKGLKIDMNEMGRTQIGFAWIDGDFWERWIKSTYGIDAKDSERVIINDEANHRYWDTDSSGQPIWPSRSSILEVVGKVHQNPYSVPYKSTQSAFMGFFRSSSSFFVNHPFLSLGMVAGAVTAVVLAGKSRRRGYGRGGFTYHGEKDGLLGGGFSGGKHD